MNRVLVYLRENVVDNESLSMSVTANKPTLLDAHTINEIVFAKSRRVLVSPRLIAKAIDEIANSVSIFSIALAIRDLGSSNPIPFDQILL